MARIRTLDIAPVGGSLDIRRISGADLGGGEVAGVISGALGVAADLADRVARERAQAEAASLARKRMIDSTRLSGQFNADAARMAAEFNANPGDIETFTTRLEESLGQLSQSSLQGVVDEETIARVRNNNLKTTSGHIVRGIKFESDETLRRGREVIGAANQVDLDSVRDNPALLADAKLRGSARTGEALANRFIGTQPEAVEANRAHSEALDIEALNGFLLQAERGETDALFTGLDLMRKGGTDLSAKDRAFYENVFESRIANRKQDQLRNEKVAALGDSAEFSKAFSANELTPSRIEEFVADGTIERGSFLHAELLKGFDVRPPEADRIKEKFGLRQDLERLRVLADEDEASLSEVSAVRDKIMLLQAKGFMTEDEADSMLNRLINPLMVAISTPGTDQNDKFTRTGGRALTVGGATFGFGNKTLTAHSSDAMRQYVESKGVPENFALQVMGTEIIDENINEWLQMFEGGAEWDAISDVKKARAFDFALERAIGSLEGSIDPTLQTGENLPNARNDGRNVIQFHNRPTATPSGGTATTNGIVRSIRVDESQNPGKYKNLDKDGNVISFTEAPPVGFRPN